MSIRKNSKWCWVAKEVSGGWRLNLCIGEKMHPLKGLIFKTEESIDMITSGKNGNILFVHLKNTRFPERLG